MNARLDEFISSLELDDDIQSQLLAQSRDIARSMSPAGLDSYIEGAMALKKSGRGNNVVVAYLQSMPQVIRECGEDIVTDCLSAAMKLASMTSGEVLALLFSTLPGVASNLGDGELLRRYLVFIHQLASNTARALRPMLGQIDELLSKLTLTGLRRWANFGAQAYRRDFANLSSYFALESEDARAMLQQQRRGVQFVRVQRKLNFYLRALWGRDFFLRPGGADGIEFRPYIEHNILHLPDALDDVGDVPGLELYRAAAAHMAAHLAYSDAPLAIEQLSPAQMFFIGMVEDARVEYCATQRFPGLKSLWRSLLIVDSGQQAAHPSLAVLKQLALMLLDKTIAPQNRTLQRIVSEFHSAVARRCDDTNLCKRLGLALFDYFAAEKAVPSLRILERIDIAYRDDNRRIWSADEFDWMADPDYLPERQQQVHRDVGLMEMINEVDNELAGDDAQEIWTCSSELHPYEDDLNSTESFNQMWGKERVSPPFYYPEWDQHIQLHRPAWTTVHERRQALGDPEDITVIMEEYKPIVHRIRQIIDLLTPAGVQRIRNMEDGDEIDLNAAIDATIAIRMHQQPSSRITMRNVLNTRDLAVLVLLDLSESTNETMAGSDKSVLQLTREAAALVAVAIDGIGDAFALHGFASDGRHDVQYYRFKDFNQQYDDEARARLAGIQGALSTRMGAALRHAGYHLSRQPEQRKLILLVTDGEPADIDERDPQHLRHDTRKAVEELSAQGVPTYCLTLDPHADAYVKRIFGANNYTIIDSVNRLPEKLPMLFASLTS